MTKSDDQRGLALLARPDGTVLKVRVSPGARRERIAGVHGDALKVSVAAPPEQGKANRRLLEILAAALGMRTDDLDVITGCSARDKRVLVRGVAPQALRTLLAGCL